MVQVNPTESPRSKGQRNSVTAARIRERGTKPTTPTIVQNTKPMELLTRISDPTTPRAETLKVVRVNPKTNGVVTRSRSHI